MDGACGTYRRKEKCVQSFGGETWGIKTARGAGTHVG